MNAIRNARIVTAEDDFTQVGPDRAEYNLLADAVREKVHTDFVIENIGGVRSPIAKGKITYADLVAVDPFANTIVTFKASGAELVALLQQERPAVSGVRYGFVDAKITNVTINGEPLDPSRYYSGATNSYYAKFILKGFGSQIDTKLGRLDALVEYIRAKKSVSPAYDGRSSSR